MKKKSKPKRNAADVEDDLQRLAVLTKAYAKIIDILKELPDEAKVRIVKAVTIMITEDEKP